MAPVLVVNQLGKKFYRSPNRHVTYGMADLFGALFRRPPRTEVRHDEFWAVRDVSLRLEQGGSLGVIGRNGSGKTTLMKILAGIILPDQGSYRIDGNVQGLISLGAGFSEGLTGRENIINGLALRGPLPSGTRARVEEIIKFSGLRDFIESPVSTYSTGMRARLGFSICVHLEPTLIIIDEALSVGDMEFQNQCLIRLQQMKKRGVAMVLVSHSMTHIQQFCETGIWLDHSQVKAQGDVKEVVREYVRFVENARTSGIQRTGSGSGEKEAPGAGTGGPGKRSALAATGEGDTVTEKPSDEGAEPPREENRRATKVSKTDVAELFGGFVDTGMIEGIRVKLLVDGKEAEHLEMNQACELEYSFKLREPVSDLNVSIVFYRADGLHITTISTLNGDLLKKFSEGRIHCRVNIPDLGFAPGEYVVVMPIHMGRSYLHRDAVKTFDVVGGARMSWGLMNLNNHYTILH